MAVAPPVRSSFDGTTPTWDSTGAKFDEESTRVFRPVSAVLVPGVATGGGLGGTAAGVTLSSVTSLIAGTALGNFGGVATGVTFTVTAFLITGAATGTGAVSVVAPPPRRTFDRTDVRWDSLVPTFDEESTRVFRPVVASLIPGTAVIATGSVSGAVFTQVASLIAGTATAATAPVVAGQTLTTVAHLLPGAASSSNPVAVSGATITPRYALIAGTATGAVSTSGGVTFDRTTPTWDSTGVTFDTTTGAAVPPPVFIGQLAYSLIPGAATAAVVVPGVTLQTSASLLPGAVNTAPAAGTASGRTLATVLSFVPGHARGQGWVKQPEGASPWTKVTKAGDGWTVVPKPGGTWDRAA